MNEDPWKHRSAGMRCGSCMWFVAKAVAEAADILHPPQDEQARADFPEEK